MVFGGVGAGVAIADPDDSGNSSEPSGETEPGNSAEPSSPPTPTATTTPRSLPEQLRDFLHRPLSIFGNGRLPGDSPTGPGGTGPEAPQTANKTDTIDGVVPRKTEVPEPPPPPPPAPVEPTTSYGSTAEIRLPFTPAITVPVPSVPGRADMRWSINLTDPYSAYATIGETFATFNSLIADAYAPHQPTPEPDPGPQMRTFQEGPVLDADGVGSGDAITPVAAGSGGGDLPVVQAPPVVVPRLTPPAVTTLSPRTIRGVSPVPQVVAGGTAGAQTPGLRGSVTQTGTVAAEPLPPTPAAVSAASPGGVPAVRQGYPQSLRVARMGELAVVALPGVAGLLALTVSGGVIGYRQANSGRYLRQDAVRFVR